MVNRWCVVCEVWKMKSGSPCFPFACFYSLGGWCSSRPLACTAGFLVARHYSWSCCCGRATSKQSISATLRSLASVCSASMSIHACEMVSGYIYGQYTPPPWYPHFSSWYNTFSKSFVLRNFFERFWEKAFLKQTFYKKNIFNQVLHKKLKT